MARITIEDCLNRVNNRFALIHMASKRVRQLRKGSEPLIQSKNRDIVVALREIAAGRISLTAGSPEYPGLISNSETNLIESVPIQNESDNPGKGEVEPEGD